MGNCSVDEAYDRLSPIAQRCADNGVALRVVISTAFGCPFEGRVDAHSVSALITRLSADYDAAQIEGVVLADTIGVATAGDTYRLFDHLIHEHDFASKFALGVHFHDTYGQALSNVLTAVSMGVSHIESSVGGLGGCPYAPGATGNVA